MTSKNNQKKNGFTSLSIYRVADEEINKIKNNRIHYSYQEAAKTNNISNEPKIKSKDLSQSHQINSKNPPTNVKKAIEVKDVKENNYRNKSAVKIQKNYSIGSGGEFGQKSQNKNNVLRVSNESKEKDKNSKNSNNKRSVNTFKTKVTKNRKVNHIDRIIIDLVNDDCDNDTIKTESNYYKKENLYKKYISNENQENIINNNIESSLNKDNNTTGKDGLQYALNMIENRWRDKCVKSKEINIPILSNEIYNKKKEIENLMKNRKNIVKEIHFSIIKENNIRNKKEPFNNWNDTIKKEKNKFFTIMKTNNKDNFLYSENNYIKDLTRNINLPPNNNNFFYIFNNDDYINNNNKLDYKLVKPKNKNQLESYLYNYYQENKKNYYLRNKDNNEELKINPIYILNDKQVKQLCEEISNDNKSRNKNEFLVTQLSVEKQTNVDYEIVEVFTPKNKNIDNNSNNPMSKRSSELTKDLKNEKVNEVNYKREKKSSGEFGQYTPISMLSDKFGIYAVSRNVKYSVPQRQGFISILSNNKGSFNCDQLKRNNFSLKIEWCEKEKESLKNSKNTTKRNNESIDKKNDGNIIDYSKISGNSYKSSYKNSKIK